MYFILSFTIYLPSFASIPILLFLNSEDRRTLRQLQLEHALIEVRKARYI